MGCDTCLSVHFWLKRVGSRVFYKSQRKHTMRHTKAQVLDQFRYLWKVATIENPSLKTDTIAKRESWNDYTDMLCKEGDITMNQYNNWSNPF